MSITFSLCPSASNHPMMPCDFPGCCAENRCGYCDEGLVPDFDHDPSVNFSNSNALAVLRLLGQFGEEAYCGEWKADEVATVRRTITGLRNRPSLVALERRETVQEPRFYSTGLDVDGLLERLERLDGLLAKAQAQGIGVSWG